MGGWDSEAELPVDGQVGGGPKIGSGGKVKGAKAGGPGLYMIEPSGLYWVGSGHTFMALAKQSNFCNRVIMGQQLARDDNQRKVSWRSLI